MKWEHGWEHGKGAGKPDPNSSRQASSLTTQLAENKVGFG